eukprot:scaffold1.g5371.t1
MGWRPCAASGRREAGGRAGGPVIEHSPPLPCPFRQVWHEFTAKLFDALHAGGAPGRRPAGGLPRLAAAAPAAERVVALGDLHGDLEKTRRALRLAQLIDERERWVGGGAVLVQVGDVLDRGPQEIEILYLLERLQARAPAARTPGGCCHCCTAVPLLQYLTCAIECPAQQEAAAAGGAVHLLNGNHETMSVAGNFRYATPEAMHGFQRWMQAHVLEGALRARCDCGDSAALAALRARWRHHLHAHAQQHEAQHHHRQLYHPHPHLHAHDGGRSARRAALEPGGPITMRFFARQPVVLQVGGPSSRENQKAVVWARDFSEEDPAKVDCARLGQALAAVGAKRMVGQGINMACDGRVVRIDVGMSRGCGDRAPEVLEILADGSLRRLTEDQVAPNKENAALPAKVSEHAAQQPPQPQQHAGAALAMAAAQRMASTAGAREQVAAKT